MSESGRLPRHALWRSRSVLVAFSAMVLAAALALYAGRRARPSTGPHDPLLCEVAGEWRSKFGSSPDLQMLVTEIVFHGKPGSFFVGEGVVVAPAALSLPGAQEVLDVKGVPAPDRVLQVDGIRALGWAYPGTLHKDMRFVGLSLVRRATGRPVALPSVPTFETLPDDLRVDARLTAAQLDEHHGLARCKAFAPWVKDVAGAPPYTDQVLRIARQLKEGLGRGASPEKKRAEDVCAALRENAFSHHQAQVVAVMGARQIGAPAYGLLSAGVHYLIAVFVDGPGWVTLDTADLDRGFQSGSLALVTKAPVVGHFAASNDGFWIPAGAVFEREMSSIYPRSWTRWDSHEQEDDTTVTYAVALDEACR